MPVLSLPTEDGRLERYAARHARSWGSSGGTFDRMALSAVHVVSSPMASNDPWVAPAIDWEATIAYRRYIWSLGLSVAEAMDTSQRGMGFGWADALQLISHLIEAARDVPGAVLFSGVGTAIEALNGRIIPMANRALAVAARSPDDCNRVYSSSLRQVREPMVIHWPGDMFAPALKGCWGCADHDMAMDVCIGTTADDAGKVDGIKISLLNKDKEIAMRRRLPQGGKMYTGDDFNYPEGDERGYSDALATGLLIVPDVAAARMKSVLRVHGIDD